MKKKPVANIFRRTAGRPVDSNIALYFEEKTEFYGTEADRLTGAATHFSTDEAVADALDGLAFSSEL